MKLLLLVVCLSLFFQACRDSTKVNTKSNDIKLDFKYSLRVQGISYSLRFKNSDTVNIQDILPSGSDTFYHAIVNKQDRSKIDSFINAMNLSTIDSSYDSDEYDDGEEFELAIAKNDTIKKIYIHSQKAPIETKNLINWLVQLKEKIAVIPNNMK
jgi:hypothetical protein